MMDWPVVTLGSVINVTDYVANGSFESLRLNVTYSSSPEFAILVRLVDHNNHWSGPFKYVNESAYKFLSKSVVETGDVVVANVGANAGTVFRAPNLGRPMTLGPNSVLCRSRNLLEYDRDYMYQFLSSPMGQSLIETVVSGSAQPKFNKTGFRQLLIPVPPISEQWAIAEVLGALDDKIAANTKLLVAAAELSSTLFRSLSDESTQLPLSATARFVNGKAFTKGASGNGRVVVRIAELNSGIGGSTVYSDAEVGIDFTANPGDILFAWSGSLTLHRWYRPEAIINQHIFKVIPNGYPSWVIFELLRERLLYFKGIAADKATTMGHIQRHHLDELIDVPNPTAIARLDETMAGLWDRMLLAERESQTLAETRDALLPQLMSGKLRVRDAEKAVEAVV